MKETTVFYIFFILFWIYVIYSLYNNGSYKEDFISFPVSIFTKVQDQLTDTNFGKRTTIKEEIEPTVFSDLVRPILNLQSPSLLDKVELKEKVIEHLMLYANNPTYKTGPSSKYNNPFLFSHLQNKTDQLYFYYEPLEHELIVYEVNPSEALKDIDKKQNKVEMKNTQRMKAKEEVSPSLEKIREDLLEKLNNPRFLTKTKPFQEAILEKYEVSMLEPIFIYKDKDTQQVGVLMEGLLYRFSKYFAYHFIIEATLYKDSYVLHSFDIIAFKSSEDTPTLFGEYNKNKLNEPICNIDDTTSFCNPRDVISFETLQENLKKMDTLYNKQQSYRCIGKYTTNRDECISPDPSSKKIGKWVSLYPQ